MTLDAEDEALLSLQLLSITNWLIDHHWLGICCEQTVSVVDLSILFIRTHACCGASRRSAWQMCFHKHWHATGHVHLPPSLPSVSAHTHTRPPPSHTHLWRTHTHTLTHSHARPWAPYVITAALFPHTLCLQKQQRMQMRQQPGPGSLEEPWEAVGNLTEPRGALGSPRIWPVWPLFQQLAAVIWSGHKELVARCAAAGKTGETDVEKNTTNPRVSRAQRALNISFAVIICAEITWNP